MVDISKILAYITAIAATTPTAPTATSLANTHAIDSSNLEAQVSQAQAPPNTRPEPDLLCPDGCRCTLCPGGECSCAVPIPAPVRFPPGVMPDNVQPGGSSTATTTSVMVGTATHDQFKAEL